MGVQRASKSKYKTLMKYFESTLGEKMIPEKVRGDLTEVFIECGIKKDDSYLQSSCKLRAGNTQIPIFRAGRGCQNNPIQFTTHA